MRKSGAPKAPGRAPRSKRRRQQGGRSMKRRSLLALSVACLALIQAAAAHGEITYQTSFGSGGSEAGQFSEPASVSIDNSTGDVYVADNGNNRIQQFTEDGDFVRAWGYDVVASGGDDKPLV